MKKNLRIVSAAAAALLAVAPVAASAVSTVSADTPTTTTANNGKLTAGVNTTNLQTGANNTLNLSVSANVAPQVVDGNDVTNGNLTVNINLNQMPDGYSLDPAKNVSDVKVYDVTDVDSTTSLVGQDGQFVKPERATEATNFKKGHKYVAVVTMDIAGLVGGRDYYVNGSTKAVPASDSKSVHLTLGSKPFSINDATMQGYPYVKAKEIKDKDGKIIQAGGYQVSRGSVIFSDTVEGIVKSIKDAYEPASTVVGADNNGATADWIDVEQDVRDGLHAAGIVVRADNSIARPTSTFPITLRLATSNHHTATFVVDVNPDPSYGDATYPQIDYNEGTGSQNNKTNLHGIVEITSIGDTAFNYIPLNGYVDVNAIRRAFTAKVSATDSTTLPVSIDTSKVNTKVLGRYPVTVSATNAAGRTTKVTFYVTVGQKGATYVTVQADTDTVPVYKIDGNVVTTTTTTVKNGDQIATFGTVTVNGKSYTRVNGLDSNFFVETKYVDGSVKPVPATPKTIMHNSYIYDKNHKRVGTNKLAAYSTVNVYGTPTKLADGSLAYKIGDNQYVMADNIDGTSRVLSHNAYVYKTSKKRADRRVLKKGATVVTYGSPYTFKNGKAYYRIGGPKKQYVKVANFK
ncbi:SLAP domain-containing protein [Lactobacillus rizhaonensis]|uniref:SLAP domain-containing protein n=1 Tax=Lactobacillus rizhaonensis TaxID=3082863 RepID=UPI0030C752D6